MKNQTKWIVAALAGALMVAPAAAQGDKDKQSTDRAGSSPLSTEKSRDSAISSPPSYEAGQQPADPGTKRDREQAGRDLSGTGSAANSDTRTGSSSTGSSAMGSDATSTSRSGATTSTASNTELLNKLHAGNQTEIRAGQMMEQTAQNDKVKDFAKKMVKDHQDMDKDLQKFAQKQGISLTGSASPDPTARRDQEHMSSMQGMAPAQAEKHYMDMMVNDHQRDVSEVRSAEQQAKSANDKELASLLDKTAKKMEDHLKDAQKIQRDLGSRQARNPSR